MRSKWPVAVLMLVIASVFGCSKEPEVAKRQYVESGDRYTAAKKYPEAIIQYRNAIAQDPRYGEARYKLAEVLASAGDPAGAYREYVRAADLLPSNAAVQLRAGQVLLLARQFPEAKERA